MDDLGLDSKVLRRDYLYGSLLSEGMVSPDVSPATLLRAGTAAELSSYVVAHDAQTPGGVVDVAAQSAAPAQDSGEMFDVVIVGAGLSGLAAAHFIQQELPGQKVLILENHPMFGGNARRDEFVVNGARLYAPQASTVIQDLPPALAPSSKAASLFQQLGIDLQRIRVPEDQYFFGVFRDDDSAAGPAWYPNIFAAPLSERVKQDLGAFFETLLHFYDQGDWPSRLADLDKITFKDYLRQRNRSDEFFRLMGPELGAFFGFPDAVSAACVYAHYASKGPRYLYGFPGGNSGLARHIAKKLIPSAIRGGDSADAVLNGAVELASLDQPGNPTRLRLSSSAVRVQHEGNGGRASHVSVTVVGNGRRYRVRARGVIMACGGFVTRRIVSDLPAEQRAAYDRFVYAPVLWANVALSNSRALDKAGLNFLSTYLDGFGKILLRYEKIGATSDDPERPNVVGVGCPLTYPGLAAEEQEARGRKELMETPFREYERRIRSDLARVLGPWGFDPRRDIAAIAIHRWAQHGYVFGYAGFFTNGVVERARQPFGRIAFAHTDLHKFSLVMGAVEQGHRAAMEIIGRLQERTAGAAD